jgi:hypothetical protein
VELLRYGVSWKALDSKYNAELMGTVARNTVNRREVKMTITTDLIEAYLKCSAKCFLLSHGEVGTGNAYADWVRVIEKVGRLLASPTPPDLVLNRHCAECEFKTRCRQRAIDQDDLSLLGRMTEKERAKVNNRGIFTVTQLSYTFRPRRWPKRSKGQAGEIPPFPESASDPRRKNLHCRQSEIEDRRHPCLAGR